MEQHLPRLYEPRLDMRTKAGYLYGGLAMKFTKPPLSIEQQIRLLQSRGMTIANPDRAARYLAHINYYRLRAYWMPFEEKAMLGYLLKLISPGTSWSVRIRKLVDKYVPDKTASMGFPAGWRDLPMWGDGQ